MTRFKSGTFVLATDLSEAAGLAVREGLALAKLVGARVVLTHVVTPLHEGVEESTKALDKLAASLDSGVELSTKVERAISVEAGVFRVAQANKADLIVVGTHGRTGLRHALVGSNAERIVQLAERPVLCVRPPKEGGGRSRLGKPARVLCPVDFSDGAHEARDEAVELARLWGAELLLVHVVEPVLIPEAYGLPASEVAVQLETEVRGAAEAQLKELAAQLGADGLKVRGLVDEGNAARRIVALAEEQDVDLVVMATRGLTGLEHMLLGSTAERVVRKCGVPVLCLKRRREDG